MCILDIFFPLVLKKTQNCPVYEKTMVLLEVPQIQTNGINSSLCILFVLSIPKREILGYRLLKCVILITFKRLGCFYCDQRTGSSFAGNTLFLI